MEEFVQASFNVRGGVYKGDPLVGTIEDQKARERKNFPGIGSSYDKELDMFVYKKPEHFPSWTLNVQKGEWQAPKQEPEDEFIHDWNEEGQEWVKTDLLKVDTELPWQQ